MHTVSMLFGILFLSHLALLAFFFSDTAMLTRTPFLVYHNYITKWHG